MKYKGAIIGFGFIAEGHLYAYKNQQMLEITAIADVSPERRERAKDLIHPVKVFDNIDELLEQAEIDFVDVCTPPYARYEIMKKCLKNGKHVIGEKPFLADCEEYKELLSIARDVNAIIYPSHNYKYAPIVRNIYNFMRTKEFGTVLTAHFRTLRVGHALGVTGWEENWRRIPEFSFGGIIRDHGPHSIYVACYLIGQYPISVSCVSGCLNQTFTNTEDTALITLFYEDNVTVLLDLSWCADRRDTFYHIYGSKQNVLIDNDRIIRTNSDGEVEIETIDSHFNDPSHKNWFVEVLNDFSQTLVSGKNDMQLMKESFITCVVIEAAYQSAASNGKIINIKDRISKFTWR